MIIGRFFVLIAVVFVNTVQKHFSAGIQTDFAGFGRCIHQHGEGVFTVQCGDCVYILADDSTFALVLLHPGDIRTVCFAGSIDMG